MDYPTLPIGFHWPWRVLVQVHTTLTYGELRELRVWTAHAGHAVRGRLDLELRQSRFRSLGLGGAGEPDGGLAPSVCADSACLVRLFCVVPCNIEDSPAFVGGRPVRWFSAQRLWRCGELQHVHGLGLW